MEQIANWVRFSDTKATILAAGFGVVLTALAANSKTVIGVVGRGDAVGIIVAVAIGVALFSGLLTLYWLIRAIAPYSGTSDPTLNRFSWPTVAGSSVAKLTAHAQSTSLSDDAWAQSILLAELARRKFAYTGRAVWGFGAFVLLGALTIAVAATNVVV